MDDAASSSLLPLLASKRSRGDSLGLAQDSSMHICWQVSLGSDTLTNKHMMNKWQHSNNMRLLTPLWQDQAVTVHQRLCGALLRSQWVKNPSDLQELFRGESSFVHSCKVFAAEHCGNSDASDRQAISLCHSASQAGAKAISGLVLLRCRGGDARAPWQVTREQVNCRGPVSWDIQAVYKLVTPCETSQRGKRQFTSLPLLLQGAISTASAEWDLVSSSGEVSSAASVLESHRIDVDGVKVGFFPEPMLSHLMNGRSCSLECKASAADTGLRWFAPLQRPPSSSDLGLGSNDAIINLEEVDVDKAEVCQPIQGRSASGISCESEVSQLLLQLRQHVMAASARHAEDADLAEAVKKVEQLQQVVMVRDGRQESRGQAKKRGPTGFSGSYKLDFVLLGQKCRNAKDLEVTLERGVRVACSVPLAEHLEQQLYKPGALPCSSACQKWVMEMECATMVFAREKLFAAANFSEGLQLHLMADSSPLHGRDFLLTELTLVPKADNWQAVAGQLQSRMLPIQSLGLRSSALSHKLRKLRHCFLLEVGEQCLDQFRASIRTVLLDQGTESGFYTAPYLAANTTDLDSVDILMLPDVSNSCQVNESVAGLHVPVELTAEESQQLQLFFPNALPLSDLDHGLHHVMETLHSEGLWEWRRFSLTLGAFAMYFGNKGRCIRFKSNVILRNPDFSAYERGILAKLFDTCCPSLVAHRWHFVFEVLQWMLPRRRVATLLKPQELSASRSDYSEGLTPSDISLLERIVSSDKESSWFWAFAEAVHELAHWGHSLSGYLHGCFCCQERVGKPCPLKGRRGAEFAGTGYVKFLARLQSLEMNAATCSIVWALGLQDVLEGFSNCKRAVQFRYCQLFGFWSQLPWSILGIYEGEITQNKDDMKRCRTRAQKLMNQ